MFHPAPTSIHGTLMQIEQQGVLITGESGRGKSDLALALLERKHQIVADDMVLLKRHGEDIIGMHTPDSCAKMEVRGLGIHPISDLFGPHAWVEQSIVHWQLNLSDKPLELLYQHQNRHLGNWHRTQRLNVSLPTLTLGVSEARPLAIIVELANRLVLRQRIHLSEDLQ
ncbi:MAG TPA: hypothetical protein DCZ03_03260 [Gammaproteobacteria bacterium]|nr:hypothetical protein [Gammaproteobacteria bacterium]